MSATTRRAAPHCLKQTTSFPILANTLVLGVFQTHTFFPRYELLSSDRLTESNVYEPTVQYVHKGV